MGYTGKTVGQLLLSLLSCGILSWLSAVWGLIEGIMILTGSIDIDAYGNKLILWSIKDIWIIELKI